MKDLKPLINNLTWTEICLIKALLDLIGVNTSINLNSSRICDAKGTTRSVFVNALAKLEIAGLITKRSMGMKGTHIEILDLEALQELKRHISGVSSE